MVQVCIADITKGRVAVLGHAWDCHAGGRDMDEALMTHFAREFRGRTGLNAMDDPKAHAKLLVKAVKCRELLTACSTAHVRIDSLMGGRDLRFASRLHSTPTAQHTRSTPTAHPQHTHSTPTAHPHMSAWEVLPSDRDAGCPCTIFHPYGPSMRCCTAYV